MGAEAAVKPEMEAELGKQSEKESHEQGQEKHANQGKTKRPTVSYFELYKFATGMDYMLMFLGFVGACIHGASVPVASYLFGKLVDSVGTYFLFPELVYHDARKYALYFVYVGIATLFSAWLEVSCWTHTGERQAARMRIEYLKALLSQDVGFYDTESSIGEIINGFSNDTILVHESIGEQVGTCVHHVFRFFVAYAISFYLSWQLTLLTISVVPIIAVAGAAVAYIIVSLSNNSRKSYDAASEIVDQVLGQIRTVYAFGGEKKAVKSYEEALRTTLKIGKKMGLAKGMGIGLIYGIQSPIWALLLWYAKHLVQKGHVRGSHAFITIFNAVVGGAALGLASSSLSTFGKGKVAGYTILELIRRTPSDVMKHHGDTLEKVKGYIQFHNVHFSYPARPNAVIFHDLCLDIPAGKQVALVGESGSGKSTVISLIERFYDPQSGRVLLDGHDTKTLQLKWLRSQIGLVSQEPALFATSIRENILFGKENATMEEIEKAAELSNADVFISKLPGKYETQVGERGVQLSGGQKQRIAIARAMLRNPPILLLDEATSALDSDSEKSVQDALDVVMQGRTCVVVAHRLSSVKDADIIVVIRHGKVVEMGTHDELLRKEGGAFASLVKIQADGMKKISREVTDFGSGRHSRASSMSLTEKVFSFRLSGRSDLTSLRLEDLKVQGRPRASPATVQKLIKLSAPDWLVGLMGSVSATIAGASLPWITIGVTQALVSFYSFVPGYMNSEIRLICLIFIGASVPVFASCLGEHFFFGVMGENTTFRVRIQMLTAILRNEIGWFDDESNSSASIGSGLASDAVLVRSVVADLLSTVIHNIALVVTAVILAFVQQWRTSLVMVATFPITVGANWLQFKFVGGFGGDLGEAYSTPNRIAGEAVANIRTVAAFCSEEKIVGLFSKELNEPGKKGFRKGQLAGFSFGLSQCLMFCAYGLTLWYGAKLISHRVISLGAMLKSFTVLLITSFAFAETLVLAPNIMRGFRSVGSVFDVIERQTLIDAEDPNAEEVMEVKGLIEFKGVKFSYPSRPEVTIFENLNLKVKAGRSMALVGASGSGKSSVIALIARFYDPIAGKVMVDGKDIKKVRLSSLRKHIALVQQEPTLFGGTIYENIVYGREGATEAEVVEAAMAANAHSFISGLPSGYETMVGEKGVQLSGGQKQRVAIARAVLRHPKILLLDEATSALDAEAERIVQSALDDLMRRETESTTVVVVAHRLSTVQNVDSIAVLESGAVCERGSHASLLAKNGIYARLIHLQCIANNDPPPFPSSSGPEIAPSH